ncbi:exocyst complex subunit Sec6 [Schizosaccharomyces cryophilus OY26]|uniref:Exocyst complex subunit Sec6 n=1 Tax=Schizosaccharomyces cryophilus (strain OY26 / ATCC MYA-4695 / CBS 11777 / NBRC 106824 / NRRL Y48691) TaxID=653667 RepID=S9WZA9_SCHCR|nr:exocyst complex subunit Sec6 [Schizosaccharomyces cryophilus OY26]EPY50052.1 exocyst complex subunit Sec6 [Schizosaccharomyces cryophilus OY26]
MSLASSDELVYNKVADILRQSEDFYKLSSHVEKFEREKDTFDLHVKTELEKHAESLQKGRLSLQDSHLKRQKLLRELNHMRSLCMTAHEMVEQFPLISEVSRIYKNCYATRQMIIQLRNLMQETDIIEDMIREDLEQDPTMPNLLKAHFKLSKLRTFRDEAMHQASLESRSDVSTTLQSSFSNLNALSEKFDRLIFNYCRNLLELLRIGNTKTIVRVFKIIEAEEASDEMLKSIRNAQSNLTDANEAPFVNLQGSSRQLRNFWSEAKEIFQVSIAERFHQAWSNFLTQQADLELDWVLDDLQYAFKVLPELASPSFDIAKVFAIIYQQCLVNLVKDAVSSDTPAATFLNLINFHKEYRTFYQEHAPFSIDELQPPLEDGSNGILVKEYTRLFTQKIQEWSDKLFQSSVEAFVKRESEPELDSDGNYGIQGTIIFFQMITQQVTIISQTNNPEVVSTVLRSIMYVMQAMQEHWKTVMKTELQKHLSDASSAPPGLMEYLLALANDNLKCAGFMDNTLLRTFELATDSREEDLRESFGKTVDGFILLSDIGVNEIVEIISNDVKPALATLFHPGWYQSSNMKLIVDTFRDYIVDCIEHMVPGLFDVFLLESSNALTINYLRGIYNKGVTFEGPSAIQQIRSDVALAIRAFGEYMAAEHLKATFEPIEKLLLGMLDAELGSVADYFHLLKESYWDAPLSLVEMILLHRTDLDRTTIRKMVEIVRQENAKVQHYSSNKPTIFSQITPVNATPL